MPNHTKLLSLSINAEDLTLLGRGALYNRLRYRFQTCPCCKKNKNLSHFWNGKKILKVCKICTNKNKKVQDRLEIFNIVRELMDKSEKLGNVNI
jgi:NMD protein affecting ribosome stability and mRNA decay